MIRQPVAKLLLFGATGDLAQRMLLPSLYGLHADGLLPPGLTITGTARSGWPSSAAKDRMRSIPKETPRAFSANKASCTCA
jgi:glucose-6-phosphate 1-dehydrogenase